MASSISQKIRDVFEKSQERQYNLTKLAEVLRAHYHECEEDKEKKEEFFKCFRGFVECVIQTDSRDSPVEKCVQFVAKFAALFANTCDENEDIEPNDEESLYNHLLQFMIQPEYHSHSNKTVRFRICQLIQLMLSAVPRDAAMDEDLMDNVATAMLHRLQDKLPAVRCQAARALVRLQQPSIQSCPVISAYLFHMSADDSSQVRSAVLSCISLNTKTLPEVLDRTRDVSESVRKIAYQVLAQKVSIKALTSSQRLYLIKQGLLDRCGAVREIVKTQLFQAWLMTYRANLLDLLKKLDVVGAYETCCKAIASIYECSSLSDLLDGFTLLNDRKLIDFDKLDPESAVYWCQLCEHMKNAGRDGELCLENILPSVVVFCDYMQEYFKSFLMPFMDHVNNGDQALSQEEEDDKIEKEFVAEQLLKIAMKMDLSDNAGRKKMIEFLNEVISEIDVLCFPCLMSPVARCFIDLHITSGPADRDEDERVDLVASIIACAREPPALLTSQEHFECLSEQEERECKLQIAKLSVQLNEAMDDLEKNITAKEFKTAAALQQNIDNIMREKQDLEEKLKPKQTEALGELSQAEDKNDAGTVIKCLKIFTELLSSLFLSRCNPIRRSKSSRRGVHPTVLSLVESLVNPSVLNEEPEIRKEAITALGTCCLFSKELATQHFALLMQVAQADTYIVRVPAINALNDLVRLFGVQALMSNSQFGNEASAENEEELSDEADDEDVGSSFLIKFMDMLDDEEEEVRQAVVRLLTRVLVSHRILSPAVVSRLILLWYDPATRNEPSVLNQISYFLNVFPYMSKETHECIETSFLPTLRVLFNAPRSSPLASVKIDNVVELLVSITRPSIIKAADVKDICSRNVQWLEESSAHDDFAIMVSNEVLSDPHSAFVNTLCKIFPLLELNPNLTDNLKDISVLCDNMLKDVTDKQALKHIKKFNSHMTAILKSSKSIPTIEVEQANEQAEKENQAHETRADVASSPMLKNDVSKQRRLRSRRHKSPVKNPTRNLSSALTDV